jgi:hypothetical protein
MAGQVAVQAVQAVAQDAFVAVEAPLQGGGKRGRHRGHGARIENGGQWLGAHRLFGNYFLKRRQLQSIAKRILRMIFSPVACQMQTIAN